MKPDTGSLEALFFCFAFVAAIRWEYDTWDGDINNIPPNMAVVSWQVGDIPQINNIADDPETYCRLHIIVTRHNLARTVVEQAAALAQSFLALHSKYRTTISLDV